MPGKNNFFLVHFLSYVVLFVSIKSFPLSNKYGFHHTNIFFSAKDTHHSKNNHKATAFTPELKTDEQRYGEYANSVYDGDAIDRLFRSSPSKVALRLAEVAVPLGWWYAWARWDNLTFQGPFFSEEQKCAIKSERGRQLREALISTNSVTFIKSGQAMSLRPDLVKVPEYVNELAKLQDAVGTFPNQQAMRIIEEDLGAAPEDIYEFLEKDPIASASIGQVYKCRLRSTNQTVAVKVQRPEAFQSAALDMYLLRNFAGWFKKWKGLRSDMVGIADEFGKQLFGELDYEQEARNCRRFKDLYGKIEGIYVPDVLFNYTSRRVLTMEWVDGEKGPWKEDGEKMLAIGLQCSVMQILDTGFFHADPHRGNLLKTPSGKLAYLDFGMMANVSDSSRFGLISASMGLQYKDIDLLTRNLVVLGFLPDTTQIDILIPALQQAFLKATGGSGSNLNFTKLSASIQELSYLLEFRIPPFYSLIVRTLTILEGLALGVDPDFKLIRGAFPFIAKQILTTNSEEFKKLIERILITDQKRIQWSRLEQLLSISRATTTGSFKDLKKAQERSDLRKKYLEEARTKDEDVQINLDIATEVLKFLSSENGRFLREPLINELVDTADSLGIVALNMASVATQGLFPKASLDPDRERVEVVAKLLAEAVNRASSGLADEGLPGEALFPRTRRFPAVQIAVQRAVTFLQDRKNQARLAPLLSQSRELAAEVSARILEKNLARMASNAIEFFAPRPFSKPLPSRFSEASSPKKRVYEQNF